jgi:hypothetical protein
MPSTKKNKALEAELLKLTSDRINQIIFEVADSEGVTVENIFKTIYNGMISKVEKAAFDPALGRWFYSKKYIDQNVRLKAARLGAENRGLVPAKNTGLELDGEITLKVIYEDKLPKKDES